MGRSGVGRSGVGLYSGLCLFAPLLVGLYSAEGGIVARDTSCGLLDLNGTHRSACYETLGK